VVGVGGPGWRAGQGRELRAGHEWSQRSWYVEKGLRSTCLSFTVRVLSCSRGRDCNSIKNAGRGTRRNASRFQLKTPESGSVSLSREGSGFELKLPRSD
jgi:hypothetical protein